MISHQRGSRCRTTSHVGTFSPESYSPYTYPSAPTHPCVGSQFSWNNLGYIFDSYPFTIHDPASRHNPGYDILSVDAVACVFHVRAKRCHGVVSVPYTACPSCLGLGPSIEVVRDWAKQDSEKKSFARLSHRQLTERLASLRKRLKTEQTKRADYIKMLTRARKKLATYQRFYRIISTNNVPGLPRLLSNSADQAWSISKTAEMALLSSQGKYHPRNYTAFDKDLAILIYELGGGGALHALNKAPSMLPSRHTIANIRRKHRLRISVGEVTISSILENIEILFKDDIEVGAHQRVGITLSQDEIAGDGRACYLPETDEIGGLCEHTISELDTHKVGCDLESIKAASRAVREGRVHVGKEFSVAAFSRHAESDYGAKPVLLMPTYKVKRLFTFVVRPQAAAVSNSSRVTL
ncbi:hypothetical protein R3P38DRAFT_3500041 [Favolaschia claudopus]|uniref:Uncharacterized protein n=1 Tax=Favolaschia claudopus TaxID=2862362 RepID=A0AAW0C6V7_9AGAR